MLLAAAKSSIAAILSKVLPTYLHVDSHDIGGKLVSGDGDIIFRNVKIREQVIPISIQDDNLTCSMVIGGTVEELALNWTWSSLKHRLLEDSSLTIRGLHFKISYRYALNENKEKSTRTKRHDDAFNPSPPEEETPKPKKENLFTSYLKEEMHRLQNAVISNLRESQFFQQAIQDVIDSFSIRIDKVMVDMLVPSTGQTVEAGFEYFHFDSDSILAQQDYSVRLAPLMMDVTISKLYANIKDSFDDSRPILEPFTYRFTSRRFSGSRFVNRLHGYEVLGHSRHETASGRRIDQGIVLHHSAHTKEAIERIQKAWCGRPVSEPDYDAEIYRSTKDKHPDPWPVSAKIVLWLFCQLAIVASTSAVRFGLMSFHVLQNHDRDFFLWIFGGISAVIATLFMVRLDLNPDEEDRIRRSQEKANKSKKINEQPATFRLPLPFITVLSPDGVRMDLTKISFIGQVDLSTIYAYAEGFDCNSKRSVLPGPHVTVSGIRASYVQRRLLVNIDLIDGLFIPNYFRLTKALECSVVKFEEGRMKIKLRTLKGWILSEDENDITPSEAAKVNVSDDDFSLSFRAVAAKVKQTGVQTGKAFETTGKMIQKTGKVVELKVLDLHNGMRKGVTELTRPKSAGVKTSVPSQDKARNRMNAELYEYLVKLQRIASIFEKVPVQNNREKLRLYPNSFRGSEAVDFMLENNMAESRDEAVKMIKDFEVQFNLFQSVTKEYKFHDDYHCLFRFVDPSQRRNWKKEDLPYDYIEDFDREPVPSALPFPLAIFAQTVVLHKVGEDDDDGDFGAIRNARLFLENGKLSRSIEFTFFADFLKTYMMAFTNGRLHGLIHPDVPNLIHQLQVSVDKYLVNPEFSVEDWLEKFGFVEESASERKDQDNEETMEYTSAFEPYSLPYAFVSEFSLLLSYSGPVMKAKESLIKVDPFVGTASTTSNDLVKQFVYNVLGRSPTVLTHMRLMGVNPVQSTSIGVIMTAGAKFVPLGQYMVIGAMALYDGICVTIDTGKAARHDPTGHHHSGDFFRGLWAMGGETARYGAKIRGKTDDEFYDENDQVKLDPLDFVYGATHGVGSYANQNKAKFAGAYVAAAVMIGTTVAFGPLGGIVAGVIAGAGTEAAVKKIERRFGGNQPEENYFHESMDDGDKSE